MKTILAFMFMVMLLPGLAKADWERIENFDKLTGQVLSVDLFTPTFYLIEHGVASQMFYDCDDDLFGFYMTGLDYAGDDGEYAIYRSVFNNSFEAENIDIQAFKYDNQFDIYFQNNTASMKRFRELILSDELYSVKIEEHLIPYGSDTYENYIFEYDTSDFDINLCDSEKDSI